MSRSLRDPEQLVGSLTALIVRPLRARQVIVRPFCGCTGLAGIAAWRADSFKAVDFAPPGPYRDSSRRLHSARFSLPMAV